MSDLRLWLKEIGLGRRVRTLAERDIGLGVLSEIDAMGRARRCVFKLGAGVLVAAALPRAVFAVEEAHGVPLGAPDAPVTIIEFFSFSCSHCRRFHHEVFPDLRRRWIDPGKVRFVLRDFPLNLAALKAAQAAWCGGAARYVVLHDALWSAWNDWIGDDPVDDGLVAVLAGQGIEAGAAWRCLVDPELERRALASYLHGAQTWGVDRTPTFIINGEKYPGFLPLARFETIPGPILP